MFLLDQNYYETDLGTLLLFSIQRGIIRIFDSYILKCLSPRKELIFFGRCHFFRCLRKCTMEMCLGSSNLPVY